ncbi:three-helix bundle dimerization domain-containing protein [Leifsonia sp. 2MCAF36]|uniref:three-helix bundle dimerization domain-containing protein n=1 Tax=Leifsonia sp. 2MCAF36 TaxID=3232988 RepID=UPI003F966D99
MTTDDRRNNEEDIAVERAAERLAERYPGVPRERIDELVEKHHEGFDGAPVRDFVPVLIEHDVKEQLNAEERAG